MKKIMSPTLTLAASLTVLAGLSACSAGTVDPTATDPAVGPTVSSAAPETASAEKSQDTRSFVAGKDYRRDVSDPTHTTIVGEPVLDAEQRFIDASVNKAKVKMSREDILKAGYKICFLYREEGTNDAVLDRITAESNNDEEGKIIMMSGAAVKTLCPEYADAP